MYGLKTLKGAFIGTMMLSLGLGLAERAGLINIGLGKYFGPDKVQTEQFRQNYADISLRLLNIADGAKTSRQEVELLENKLSSIDSDDLTKKDAALYNSLKFDLDDVAGDIEAGRKIELDSRPKPGENLSQFLARTTLDEKTAKMRFNSLLGKNQSYPRPLTKNKTLTQDEVHSLYTVEDNDDFWRLIDKQIDVMESNQIDAMEYKYDKGKFVYSRNIDMNTNLKNRLIIAKATSPVLDNLFDHDISLKRIAHNNLDYLVFSPNLKATFSNAKGKTYEDILGISVGASNIGISTKDFDGDDKVEAYELLPTIKHELQHDRQIHWDMSLLKEETTPRIEQLALVKRLIQSKITNSDRLNNYATSLENTLDNVKILEEARFEDVFANAYPHQVIESGSLLEAKISYQQFEKALAKFTKEEGKTDLWKALSIASIAKDPSTSLESKKDALKQEYIVAKKYNDKIVMIDANQALAYLFPEEFERINFDALMQMPDIYATIPLKSKMNLEDENIESIRSEYVLSQALHMKDLLSNYEGYYISDENIQYELSVADKRFIYAPVSVADKHYYDSYNHPEKISDYFKAHNIAQSSECLGKGSDSYVNLLGEASFLFEGAIGDFVSLHGTQNVALVYGDKVGKLTKAQANSLNLPENMNFIIVEVPNKDYYSTITSECNYDAGFTRTNLEDAIVKQNTKLKRK